ncbi:glutathione S-transferase family protein [Pantoea sp.]|uniref:glutathione S-transferase family protein n=1 Tax=Pantoea sp. TaxID=69393 RepID=UPI0031D9C6BD
MKLYHFPLSGHAHRARLFLSLLNVPHEIVDVDLKAGEHLTPEFLAMNPFGQVPVLEDDGVFIADSNAILVYLAKKTGRSEWLPEDALGAAQVQRWLSVAAGDLAFGPAAARLITVFGRPFNPEEVITRAHLVLTRIENHLKDREWLVGDRPTIADIAQYSYIIGAPEGNVNLSGYPAVNGLLRRIEALPGFVAFPQTAAGLRSIA